MKNTPAAFRKDIRGLKNTPRNVNNSRAQKHRNYLELKMTKQRKKPCPYENAESDRVAIAIVTIVEKIKRGYTWSVCEPKTQSQEPAQTE